MLVRFVYENKCKTRETTSVYSTRIVRARNNTTDDKPPYTYCNIT